MKLRDRYLKLGLWQRIAFWGSVASVLALLLTLGGMVADFFPGNRPPKERGKLELVETAVVDGETEFTTLDLKIRNTGPVAFIKKAVFHVEKVLPYRWIYCPFQVDPSGPYDVLLPVSGSPETVSIPLSNAVPRDGVERIQLILGHDAKVPNEETGYAFLVRAELVYNKNDQVLAIPPLGFMVSVVAEPLTYTQCRDAIDVYRHNRPIGRAFADFSGIMTENLRTVVAKYDGSAVARWLARLTEAGDDQERVRYCMRWLIVLASVEETARGALEELAHADSRAEVRSLAADGLAALRRLEANSEQVRRSGE